LFKYLLLIITLNLSSIVYAQEHASTESVSEAETVASDIRICYATPMPGMCISDITDKEKGKENALWEKLIKQISSQFPEEKNKIIANLKAGKKDWLSGINHDCKAYSLTIGTDGGTAASDVMSDCITQAYAERVDFYNEFKLK